MNISNPIEAVKKTIHKYALLSPKDKVLIALSGGADSTALLLTLKDLKDEFDLTLSALYIDHRLRPDETPYEIEHCKRLCDSIGIAFSETSIDVRGYCNKKGLNLQEGARELRYECLGQRASELGFTKIALGHTAEDQAETVLMRLIRGSGVSGLAGIPPARGIIIRPLIEIDRKTLEDFVIARVRTLSTDCKEPFLIESSNLKTDYLRNKLRLLVIPQLKASNNSLLSVISRFTEIVRDEERYFNALVTKTLMRLISRKGDGFIELFWQPMEGIDRALLRRIIRRAIDETAGLRGVSFTNIEDIVELAKKGQSGSRIYINKDTKAIKGYATLLITSLKSSPLKERLLHRTGELILKEIGMALYVSEVDFKDLMEHSDETLFNGCSQVGIEISTNHPLAKGNENVLPVQAVSQKDKGLDSPLHGHGSLRIFSDDKTTAFIDADKASFPFTIRKRQPGDFFYPYGFGKKKKLQDYFVDQKIPREERDSIALITKDDKIVWIAGHRIDERFKIDKDTRGIIKFQLKPLKT